MKFTTNCILLAITLGLIAGSPARAQEKVQLEEPRPPDLLAELKESPDGVLRVKTNADGGFKALVVKASVEIENSLGAQKGKRMAAKEAEIQCKRLLAQWLEENCVFIEASNNTRTFITKGESTKDAAGNTVNIRSQQGAEVKVLTESSASSSQAVLKGLTVVSSDIIDDGKEFVLVMSLTDKSLAQSALVGDALAGRSSGSGTGTAGGSSGNDRPAPESKVNKEALKDLN